MKGKSYFEVLAVLLTAGRRTAIEFPSLNVGSARHSGPSFIAQYLTLWAPSRLPAVQKETEFLGNVNVSSRT
jgi:hypothetical protein